MIKIIGLEIKPIKNHSALRRGPFVKAPIAKGSSGIPKSIYFRPESYHIINKYPS